MKITLAVHSLHLIM